ncbi:MAG: DNA polymerase IV [Myxococcaceae bacterium]
MPRSILHVDMDAFYASVEERDEPSLKGKPVIVGGHPKRGVVLAASYEVRKFGVKSAMPMGLALKLAPKAIVVPPRPHAYAEASEGAFAIFEQFTPMVEGLSLDEAFLDVTASQGLFGTAVEIATAIREKIRTELKLTASAGIAEAKFVAKIASDLAKPDGQLEVPPGTSKAFLHPLPVSRLWGVGPRTEESLKARGLKTFGDVAAKDLDWLERELGSGGVHLWQLANAIDDRAVVPDRDAKSIGNQDTFEEDLAGEEAVAPHIHAQALRVGRRLRAAKLKTRVVQLVVKYFDFHSITRRVTLEHPTDDGQALYREALELLKRVDLRKAIRLTGVSAQDLVEGEEQLGLFTPSGPSKNDKLNQALDKIADKFGSRAVVPADINAPKKKVLRERVAFPDETPKKREPAKDPGKLRVVDPDD